MPSAVPIVAVVIRAEPTAIQRLRTDPTSLLTFDTKQALADGRAIDIGRRWEELGCLLEGGIVRPKSGPVVGDETLPCDDDRQAWSLVSPERVVAIAAELARMTRREFMRLYRVEEDSTADALPEDRTGAWGDGGEHLYKRFVELRAHYEVAAQRGQGMLVRIGERV